MPLNDMTMSDMARVADDLDAVRAAMAILDARGLVARADLTPGQPMVIRLTRTMPQAVPAPIGIWGNIPVARMTPREVGNDAPASFEPQAQLDDEGFEIETPKELWQVMGLPADPGGTVALSATITAEAPPEGNAGESGAAPEPAVTGPGEVEAEATAPEPQPAAMPPAVTSEPGGENVREPEAELPAPSPATPFGEQIAYLRGLPRKNGWTIERDRDLVEFAELGWKPPEIALQLSIPAGDIKPRFALLTKQGAYKRADVLAALKNLLGEAA